MVQYKTDFVLVQKYRLKLQVKLEKKVICFFLKKGSIILAINLMTKKYDSVLSEKKILKGNNFTSCALNKYVQKSA